ncbi:hypothetical protein [Thalassovita mangrovi]|uniref:Tetratricopeptide repeat-like domain-containing protein n=1 Tax=Thalassovita mangrovi TaxID=2692236 RepID=A0A6L8LEH9_9RHOB|nr:hypothetical protein [Thalassovita mangrovi]
MSDTDSFIEEVTEEVRRDRLFALMRRYGWIAVLAVLLLVGGAAWNEWRKAQDLAAAQALGDGIVAALDQDDAAARAEALAAIGSEQPKGDIVVSLLRAAELEQAGEIAAAVGILDALSSNGEAAPIYRQLAGFKSVLLQADTLAADQRRLRLEGLIQTGSTLRLLAEEQLALIDISEDAPQAAIERLQRIIDDAEATSGLRRRASQLIVALGGDTAATTQTN